MIAANGAAITQKISMVSVRIIYSFLFQFLCSQSRKPLACCPALHLLARQGVAHVARL